MYMISCTHEYVNTLHLHVHVHVCAFVPHVHVHIPYYYLLNIVPYIMDVHCLK